MICLVLRFSLWKGIGHHNGYYLRFRGALVYRAEKATESNHGLYLTIALSYSGRSDLVNAVRELCLQASNGTLRPEDVCDETVASALSLRHLPPSCREPDLVLRTSGEQRLSNFLLWESAYSELYFTEVLWPDFDEQTFSSALVDFASRHRRYGRVH